jgi:hypothetical protein
MDNITLKKTVVHPVHEKDCKPESEQFVIIRALNHTATLMDKSIIFVTK